VPAKPTPPKTTAQSSGEPNRRTISSEALMQGERVVVIRHGAEEYRLQLTSTGKLILTK
jgi:hemin uptake protein HemP